MAISLEGAARLSVEMSRVMKLFGSMRQHAPKVHPGVEPASYPILFSLGEFRRSLQRWAFRGQTVDAAWLLRG
jgi:hypothetical protein